MANADKYVCTLDKASIKKAAKELNEDPKERDNAVASFRQWIEQHSSWLKTPTDAKFLLGFLRNGKFVQLAARKRLVNYWTARTENKEWFTNVDTLDATTAEILKFGNMLPLPNKDADGRGLIACVPAAIDVSGKYTFDEIVKSSIASIDYLLMDEKVQVNGLAFLQDMGGLTIKHQTFFGIDGIRRSMKVWLKAYPVRYKEVHYFNTNPVFEAIFAIIKPLMPEKLVKRLHFHGKNMFEVYKYIDKSHLPQEYLPDDYTGKSVGTLQHCIDDYVKSMQTPEVRDYLLRLSSGEYGVIESLKPNEEELFAESFRKLNVD